MALLDLVDETFVVADPARVSELIHDVGSWRRWWPDLTLEVFEDRGWAGVRWNVTGALVGSAEFWLEAWGDGVLVHYYLRASMSPGRGIDRGEPATVRRTARIRRDEAREAQRRALQARRVGNDIKDRLEGIRLPGAPRV